MSTRKVRCIIRFGWCCTMAMAIQFCFFDGQSDACAALQNTRDKFPKIDLIAISKRRLPKKEIEPYVEGNDYLVVVPPDLQVRFRLINYGQESVYYLAFQDSSEPVGNTLFRKLGQTNWESSAPTYGREGSFTEGTYRWLRLTPGSAVEFEVLDHSARGEEHAATVFLNTKPEHENRVEVRSQIFRPSKR